MSDLCRQEAMRRFDIIEMKSQWVGPSQVRATARKIADTGRVVVELQVLSPEDWQVPHEKLNSIARELAMDHTPIGCRLLVLRDYLTSRKCRRLDGSVTETTIREKVYLF